jgi:hypothetical protein
MTRRQKLITALAAAHLLLVAFSSALLPLPAAGNPVGDGLRWYGAVSGANNSYGFFKQVGCGLRARFTMLDAEGHEWTDTLHDDENHEVRLRFDASVNMIGNVGEAITRQWAAVMFGRHPKAQVVFVEVQIFDPGTMEEYRAGNRPSWQTAQTFRLIRSELLPQGVEGK